MKLIRYLEMCKQLSAKAKRTEDSDLKIKEKKSFLNDCAIYNLFHKFKKAIFRSGKLLKLIKLSRVLTDIERFPH